MAENSIPPFNQDLVASEVVRQALSDRFPSQKSGKQVTYSLEQAGIKTLRTRIRIGHPGQQMGGYFKREQESPLENKSPLDMSAQELEAFVKKGREEMQKQEQILGNA